MAADADLQCLLGNPPEGFALLSFYVDAEIPRHLRGYACTCMLTCMDLRIPVQMQRLLCLLDGNETVKTDQHIARAIAGEADADIHETVSCMQVYMRQCPACTYT